MLTACAGTPTYYNGERLAIEPTLPLALPALPDAERVTDRSGVAYAGYSADDVDALIRYAVIAQANTDIATANADTVTALNAEAQARNRVAEKMEAALAAEQRQHWFERLGWLGVLGLIGAIAL